MTVTAMLRSSPTPSLPTTAAPWDPAQDAAYIRQPAAGALLFPSWLAGSPSDAGAVSAAELRQTPCWPGSRLFLLYLLDTPAALWPLYDPGHANPRIRAINQQLRRIRFNGHACSPRYQQRGLGTRSTRGDTLQRTTARRAVATSPTGPPLSSQRGALEHVRWR